MSGISGFCNIAERNASQIQFPRGYPNHSPFWNEKPMKQTQLNYAFNDLGIEENRVSIHNEPNVVSHRANSRNSYRHSQRGSRQMQSSMYQDFANKPLTKQVDQLIYELPQHNKFSINSLCQPPEFLKVFSDVRCMVGEKAVFDCVLLGSPRPRVCWLFNDEKIRFDDVFLEDTSDVCRCTVKRVRPHHYGIYSVGLLFFTGIFIVLIYALKILAENEIGRAISTATLLPR